MEMFVGVGASRVRDLFQQAKQASPAIIFIAELDKLIGALMEHERVTQEAMARLIGPRP